MSEDFISSCNNYASDGKFKHVRATVEHYSL